MSQCMETLHSKSKSVVSTAFCTRRENHEGDHRGYRRQWTKKGDRVKITLPPDVK